MTALTIHIDEATERRLRAIAEELHRNVHELAESAVAEAALSYFRSSPISASPGRATLQQVQGANLQ